MPETGRTAMPAHGDAEQPHDRVARAVGQIRTLLPATAQVRAHVSPSGAYCVAALDARGTPLVLSAAEARTLGAWVVRALPDVDRARPRTLDLATGRVTCALTGEDLTPDGAER